MIFSIWYNIEEKKPDESGWYLAFKDISIGDDYTDLKHFYYNKLDGNFYESALNSSWGNIKYWTEIDFNNITHKSLNPAEQLCADKVISAIDNYNIITGLSY